MQGRLRDCAEATHSSLGGHASLREPFTVVAEPLARDRDTWGVAVGFRRLEDWARARRSRKTHLRTTCRNLRRIRVGMTGCSGGQGAHSLVLLVAEYQEWIGRRQLIRQPDLGTEACLPQHSPALR